MAVDAEYRDMVTTIETDNQAVAAPVAKVIAPRQVVVIGAGPAGLFAAERLSVAGHAVTVVDRMPSPARKFLMAGRGGLNLTHSEGLKDFLTRYGADAKPIVGSIHGFRPNELILWAHALGQPTFLGSSGRVFPGAMKASPLLRAWLKRLKDQGVVFAMGERWLGWDSQGALLLRAERDGVPGATRAIAADAVVLALGGASWPRLGADGGWTQALAAEGITIKPWQAANAGVHVPWSPFFAGKFAGTPLKRLGVTVSGAQIVSEAMVTRTGLEGGAIYAVGAELRAAMAAGGGSARLRLDLKPGMTVAELAKSLAKPRGKQSMANHLRKFAGLPPVMVALVHESVGRTLPADPEAQAKAIKDVALTVTGFAGLERAISSAGGIALDEIDGRFMLVKKPGVFVAGEMLDWTAPTGGYLLQACFATGKAAADGVIAWLGESGHPAEREQLGPA